MNVLTRVLKSRSDVAKAHYRQGREFMRQQRWDMAEHEFQQGLSAKADDFLLRFALGVVFSKQDRLDEAIRSYNIALEINPNLPRAHFNLALVYQQMGNPGRAVREAERALRMGLAPARTLLEELFLSLQPGGERSAARRPKREPIPIVSAQQELTGEDLTRLYQEGWRDFRSKRLDRIDLRGADLRDADFSDADLINANLFGANLTGAKFVGAKLYRGFFQSAILRGTNLNGALLKFANLSGADLGLASLRGADLSGCNLCGAQVTDHQLSQAASTRGATLPDDNFVLSHQFARNGAPSPLVRGARSAPRDRNGRQAAR